jgi:PAS domain S-box-containing protein
MNDADTTRAEATYRLLVEAVIDYAIVLLDTEGRVVSWNPGARRLKGYAPEEIIGSSFAVFFTEEDRRLGLPEGILETARQDGRAEAEGWRLRKDGTRFWGHTVLDAVHDDAGRLIGFANITRDTTKRHEAEVALRESERRFRLLVQGVTDYAIFMLDPEGRVIDWNTGAQQIKGYAAQEIIGQHFSRFYTKEDRATELPRRALEQAATTGRFEDEGWRVRKDGRQFWASVVIDAVRDEDGVLVGFAKVTRDITERHEAQRASDEIREQMAQLQRLEALGQLTAGIAHNFSNLIQIILSGIRLANSLVGGNDQLKRILADMAAAAQQRAGLTEHLLAFAQHHPAEPELVDVAGQIREVADLFSRSLRGNIRVQLDLAAELWPIRVDATQFELALLNVALNARDAMPDGGQFEISARNVTLNGGPDEIPGRAVAIRLRDSGVGIPRGVLGRVLEPFFTTKPRGEGTGLGLSQAYGFAEQAGGALRIQSTPGQGTEVTFVLPAVSEHDAADAASPATVSGLARPTAG